MTHVPYVSDVSYVTPPPPTPFDEELVRAVQSGSVTHVQELLRKECSSSSSSRNFFPNTTTGRNSSESSPTPTSPSRIASSSSSRNTSDMCRCVIHGGVLDVVIVQDSCKMLQCLLHRAGSTALGEGGKDGGVVTSPQKSSSSGITAAVTSGAGEQCLVDINMHYCGPVRVAVELDRSWALDLLLCDRRIDPNTGCPLRVAVTKHHWHLLPRLLECPRICVNRGFPLFYAVREGHLEAVKLLAGNPSCNVNRYAPGDGLSPLGCSIRRGHYDIFCHLLANHRVDINRGFALTPLQICAEEGKCEFASALLSRPSLCPNRALGETRPPLTIAIDRNSMDMVRLLLSDPRVFLSEELINSVEEENQVDAMQVLAVHSQDYRLGMLWTSRFLVVFLLLATSLSIGTVMLVLLLSASARGDTLTGVLVTFIHLVGSGCAFYGVRGRPLLALLPFLPIFAVWCFVGMVQSVFGRVVNMQRREDTYRAVSRFFLIFGASVCVPLLVLLLFGFGLHVPSAPMRRASELLLCSCLAAICWNYTVRLRPRLLRGEQYLPVDSVV